MIGLPPRARAEELSFQAASFGGRAFLLPSHTHCSGDTFVALTASLKPVSGMRMQMKISFPQGHIFSHLVEHDSLLSTLGGSEDCGNDRKISSYRKQVRDEPAAASELSM